MHPLAKYQNKYRVNNIGHISSPCQIPFKNFSIKSIFKVLVLDEATAAVDLDTDATIQSTIRKAAKDRGATIITVAHRINTVLDYDKIIVLDRGEVKEIGSPVELMNDDQSEFGKMAKQSGLSLNDIKDS